MPTTPPTPDHTHHPQRRNPRCRLPSQALTHWARRRTDRRCLAGRRPNRNGGRVREWSPVGRGVRIRNPCWIRYGSPTSSSMVPFAQRGRQCRQAPLICRRIYRSSATQPPVQLVETVLVTFSRSSARRATSTVIRPSFRLGESTRFATAGWRCGACRASAPTDFHRALGIIGLDPENAPSGQ